MARPQKYSVEEVREIISQYVNSEFYNGGLIKYQSVFDFTQELQNKGIIQSTMSVDFWRKSDRMGRIEIERTNKILSKTVVPPKTDDAVSYLTNVDIDDFLVKNYKDKDILAKMFLKLQDELRSLLKEKSSLEARLENVQEKLDIQMDNVQHLKKTKERLQDSLLQIFEYSGYSENGLINLQKINNKKKMNPFLKEALLNMLDSPSAYLNVQEFEEPVDNVVEFNNQKKKTEESASDDYDFI